MKTLWIDGVEYVAVKDLASERGVFPQAVYNHVRMGKLESITILRSRLIPYRVASLWYPGKRGGNNGGGRPKKDVSQNG